MIPLHETAFDQTKQGKSKRSSKWLTCHQITPPQVETNTIVVSLASKQKYE